MMTSGAAIRSLAHLGGASSARVLNLMAVRKLHQHEEEYRSKPFFSSPVLNNAIILKHRLRSDDAYQFHESRTIGTKIIVPFDKDDLRLGGASFFFGQKSYVDVMREVGRYGGTAMDRDIRMLEVLHELPSLDPFLIHERLAMDGLEVADCYFELSAGDKKQMHEFVAREISALIQLACSDGTANPAQAQSSAARLSSALLSNGAERHLEPLRRSLMLEEEDFKRGVFSWRGFLYYKWRHIDLIPKVRQVVREIVELPVKRTGTADEFAMVRDSKMRLGRKMLAVGAQVSETIALYTKNYAKLIEGNDAQSFRKFLLGAPRLFLDLGERFGGIAHIESFWRYRFPKPLKAPMPSDEAMPMFADFLSSVGADEGAEVV